MDILNIINFDGHAGRTAIVSQKHNSPINRVYVPNLAGVLLVRAPLFQAVRNEIDQRNLGMMLVVDNIINESKLLIQQLLLVLGQFELSISQSARFRDHTIKSCQCCERRELCCTVVHAHVRSVLRLMMRQMDDIGIGILLNIHHSSPALWPPIWLFLSIVVPPSMRFIPLSMAFLPNLS